MTMAFLQPYVHLLILINHSALKKDYSLVLFATQFVDCPTYPLNPPT